MVQLPPDGVKTAPTPLVKQPSSKAGMEKSAAFAPVNPLTPVMVAEEADPLPMVTDSKDELPANAWKFSGLGFADTAVEPLPVIATVKGLPVAPVYGAERFPLKFPEPVGAKVISRKHSFMEVTTWPEQLSSAKVYPVGRVKVPNVTDAGFSFVSV